MNIFQKIASWFKPSTPKVDVMNPPDVPEMVPVQVVKVEEPKLELPKIVNNAFEASGQARLLIINYEDLSLSAYPDPGSKTGKPYTIGYGHTGSEVKLGLVWNVAQAEAALAKDMAEAVGYVLKYVKKALTQCQLDALASFVFNLGPDQFKNSTLCRLLNEGKMEEAALQFPRWKFNDGVVMKGLVRRRAAEQAMFNGKSAAEAIAIGLKA